MEHSSREHGPISPRDRSAQATGSLHEMENNEDEFEKKSMSNVNQGISTRPTYKKERTKFKISWHKLNEEGRGKREKFQKLICKCFGMERFTFPPRIPQFLASSCEEGNAHSVSVSD